MLIVLIGSAAGGGVPQWNCNHGISRRARSGDRSVRARQQSSIAVSAGEDRGWVLFNASPDIRQQIAETRFLQPAGDAPLRSTPIRAIVLTNADVDHLAGLLSLRERQAFNLYATARVLDVLEQNPIFRVLDPRYVRRIALPMERSVAIEGPDGPTGIEISLFPVPGKVALYLETGDAATDFDTTDGGTVGVRIAATSTTRHAHYVPGCASVDARLKQQLRGSAALLFDGTVFVDDELARAGVGLKSGQRMGHLAIAGPDGSLEALAGVDIARRIYVHINNTNPILDEASPERLLVQAAGWEVGFDGMEIRI